MAATHQVLSTTELLEQILHQATPLTILRVSQTCRRFNTVVTSSSELQRQLYFKAASCVNQQAGQPNQLLLNLGAHKTNVLLTFMAAGTTCPKENAKREPITANSSILLQLTSIPKPGSCISMFLTQPPAKVVEVYSHHHGESGSVTLWETTVKNDNGVTWGDVCQAIVATDCPVDWEDRIWEAAERVAGTKQGSEEDEGG